nr:hypothetical protein GCM10020093_015850 [Planobispora longispora]
MIAPVHAESPSAPPAGSSSGERELAALTLPPGPELFRAVAAALDGDGPAVLPLSPGLPAPALRATLAALRPTLLDGVRQAGGAGVPAEVAVVIATSGTTGTPKGVQLPPPPCAPRPRRPWSAWRPGPASAGSAACPLARLGPAGAGQVPAGRDRADHPRRFLAGGGARRRGRPRLAGADPAPPAPGRLGRPVGVPHDPARRGRRSPDLLAAARAADARIVTTYGMSETCGGCVYDGGPLTE